MARRSAAQRAATKRMIAGLKRSRSRRRSGGGVVVLANPKRRSGGKRRRRRSVVVMANPRRRRSLRRNARHIGRRRRRRNPAGDVMEAVKNVLKVGLPAVVAGAAFGLVDAKLLTANNVSQPIRYGSKVGFALALGLLFRKNPELAAATMGGVLGSLGSDAAASLGGGTPAAPTTTAAVKGIGALLREDRQAMGLLLTEMQGMGYSVENNVSLGRGLGSVGVGDDTEQFTDVNLG
jgi:hypothetical protein